MPKSPKLNTPHARNLACPDNPDIAVTAPSAGPLAEAAEAKTSQRGVIPRSKRRIELGANDGPVDDYIALTENWTREDGGPLIDATGDTLSQAVLNRIATQFQPGQMRQLGADLFKLADALDSARDPARARSGHHSLATAGQIEPRALQLAQVAVRLRAAAQKRNRYLSAEWLGEPAWNILLELFIQFAAGARVSTKCLTLVSGAPDTTALRIIDRLAKASLIERSSSKTDRRVMLVSLTQEGVIAVGSALMEAED